jgi:PIN domain nuclease of toxin-antitoxin system
VKILLDTRLLLWWLADSPSLPREAHALIRDPANTLFVSAVTLWEIWLKVSLSKLTLPSDFAERLADEAFEHLPLTSEQTSVVALLPWHHRDPFDRMLVAQAKRERLTLATADDIIALYGDFVRLVR